MKKIIVDTNGYLRLFLNDIPDQANKIEKLLKQAQNDKIQIILPQIIVFEIHFALEKYYHFSKEEVADILKTLLSTDYIQVESRQLFILTLNLYCTVATSFVDCFILSKTKLEKAKLITFDKKLKKITY